MSFERFFGEELDRKVCEQLGLDFETHTVYCTDMDVFKFKSDLVKSKTIPPLLYVRVRNVVDHTLTKALIVI